MPPGSRRLLSSKERRRRQLAAVESAALEAAAMPAATAVALTVAAAAAATRTVSIQTQQAFAGDSTIARGANLGQPIADLCTNALSVKTSLMADSSVNKSRTD
jgi:hypothetical protein